MKYAAREKRHLTIFYQTAMVAGCNLLLWILVCGVQAVHFSPNPYMEPTYPRFYPLKSNTIHLCNQIVERDAESLRCSIQSDPSGKLADLSFLQQLPTLKKLDLELYDRADLRPLHFLKNLTELDLFVGAMKYPTDLTPLSTLPHLEALRINIHYGTHYEAIGKLTSLKWLTFVGITMVHRPPHTHSLRFLSTLSKLKMLILPRRECSFEKGNYRKEFRDQKELTQQQRYELSQLPQSKPTNTDLDPFADLRPLATLQNLESLLYLDCDVAHLDVLYHLPRLKEVWMTLNGKNLRNFQLIRKNRPDIQIRTEQKNTPFGDITY
jgi:hypothetical protein